jgi:hypothetical protein
MWKVAAALASPVVLGFLFRRRQVHQTCHEEPFLSERGFTGRKMGPFEAALDYGMEKMGLLLNVNAVFIGCKVQITADQVRLALRKLYERHPNLRMRVVVNEENRTERYFAYLDSEPDLEVIPTEAWKDVAHEELASPMQFKIDELQWRVKMLKPHHEGGIWVQPFVFIFNHCILDGGSIMAGVNTDFHRFLNEIVTGRESPVEPLPLLPCRDEMYPELMMPWYDYLWLKLTTPFRSSGFAEPDHLTSLLQGSIRPADCETIPPTTKLEVFELSVDDTLHILSKCRAHGIKFNGYVSAAVASATMALLGEKCGVTDNRVQLKTAFMANIRRFANPPVPPEQVICMTSFIPLDKVVPAAANTNPEKFWELAKQCHRAVHGAFTANLHMREARLIAFDFVDDLHGTLEHLADSKFTYYIYYTTNRGAFEIKPPAGSGENVVTFEGTYWATADQCINDALFVPGCVTVNGKFMFSLAYYSHKTTEENAKNYCEIIREVMLFMSK